MTLSGETKFYYAKEIEFSYRHSTFKEDEILIASYFKLNEISTEEIQEKRNSASQGRKANQPLRFRSAGSVFKNPKPDLAAGYLIDQAGLKGTRSGDAEISEKHANFFVNHGQASASDNPAPAAGPGITASVGFAISCSKRLTSIRLRRSCTLSSKAATLCVPEDTAANRLTSPPAQNARPAPVNTTTRTPGSAARRGKAFFSPAIISGVSAFRDSGLFNVRVAMPLFCISCNSSVIDLLRIDYSDV
jgi:hypothetical protein